MEKPSKFEEQGTKMEEPALIVYRNLRPEVVKKVLEATSSWCELWYKIAMQHYLLTRSRAQELKEGEYYLGIKVVN